MGEVGRRIEKSKVYKVYKVERNMVKAIIFDAGGVYLEGSFVDFINKAHKILGINNTPNVDSKAISNPDLNSGVITIEEFFKKLFKMPISENQMEEIKNVWITNWTATDEMIELVRSLKKNYKLAILSNSDALGVKNCFKKGSFSYFDCLILSHEVGVVKPDKRIYKIVLDKLNLESQRCLFIDDQEDALKPAREMGMKTILFKSIEQLKREFDKINIKY